MASEDPLNRRMVEQMLVGVATRQYVRSLEPLPPTMTTRKHRTANGGEWRMRKKADPVLPRSATLVPKVVGFSAKRD